MARAHAHDDQYLSFRCPGCEDDHTVTVSPHPHPWIWNGSLDRPTISPSIRVSRPWHPTNKICHSFVREGRIEFLGDCMHALAGKTVDLPEWPEGKTA
jgi:hypothetical protein